MSAPDQQRASPFPPRTILETTRDLPFVMDDHMSYPRGTRFTVYQFLETDPLYPVPTYQGVRLGTGKFFTAPADAVQAVTEPSDPKAPLPTSFPEMATDMSTVPDETVQTSDPRPEPELPVFRGTPEDWWEAAEEITESHAAEKNLGDWYITWLRGTKGPTPAFRVATPSRPPNMAKRNAIAKGYKGDPISENVRRLIKASMKTPAWMLSEFVMADVSEGSGERGPWHRKPNGKWQLVRDGRIHVYDVAMSKLNPTPATFN